MGDYNPLALENQLCFPLYAASRAVIKKYKPFLNEIGLTYTQYIVMMVLWAESPMNVKALGERLYLDSGTLTPLLKKLEKIGIVTRSRSDKDERELVVSLTERGEHLREQAVEIPSKMSGCVSLTAEDVGALYGLLYKLLDRLR
ncbi:MAG: MarR family transcriptional regulator [Oscillospiraceae bacterium]|jgi:DNA-binding MarR family transcriptional regulator|nr:MarR family transcriptional regulator [Oscillospiraceae bacterium]